MQSYIYSAIRSTISPPERYNIASSSYSNAENFNYRGEQWETLEQKITQSGDAETNIRMTTSSGFFNFFFGRNNFNHINGETTISNKDGSSYSAEWWVWKDKLSEQVWSKQNSNTFIPAAPITPTQYPQSLEVPCGTETFSTYTESDIEYEDDGSGYHVPKVVTYTLTVLGNECVSTTSKIWFPTKYETTIANGVATITAVDYQSTSFFATSNIGVTSTATRVATSKLQWMWDPNNEPEPLTMGTYTIRYQADEGEMLCVGNYAASDYSTHLYYDVTSQDSLIQSVFSWVSNAPSPDLGEWTVSSSSSEWEALSLKGFNDSNRKTRTVNVRSRNILGVVPWRSTTTERVDNQVEFVTTTTSSSWHFGGGYAGSVKTGFTWTSPVVTHQMTSKKVIDRIVGVVSNPPFKTYSVLNVNSSWNRPSSATFTEAVSRQITWVHAGKVTWGAGTEKHYKTVTPHFVISQVGVTYNNKCQFLQKKVNYSDLHDHWAAANRTNEAKSFLHSAMFENYPEWVVADNHAIVPILHFEKDITYEVTSHSNSNSNSRTTVWRASIDGANTTVSRTTFNSSTSSSYSELIRYSPLDNATTADVYDVAGVAGGYCNGEPITVVCKSGGAYRVTKGNTNPSASASTFITTWIAGDIMESEGVCIVATPVAFLGDSMGNGSGTVIGAGAFLDRN